MDVEAKFDPRPYFQRMADVDPTRFHFDSYGYFVWHTPSRYVDGIYPPYRAMELSAFILPLAEELDVDKVDMYWRCPMGCRETDDDGNDLPPRFSGIVEATFAAVCYKLEGPK